MFRKNKKMINTKMINTKMIHKKLVHAVVLIAVVTCVASAQEGPSFPADYKFEGSLTGWKTLGAAEWKVQNGEIVGKPKQPSGGWLMLDKSFSNIGAYADILCATGCNTGILFRAEKTASGMKGIYVSLTEGDQVSYAVTLDAEGKELTRVKLTPTPGLGVSGGLANEMGNLTPERLAAIMKMDFRPVPLPEGVSLPGLASRATPYHSGDWNEVNIVLYGDMLDPSIGASGITSGSSLVKVAAPASAGSYGSVAIYAGGTGEVRLKDFRYKDLNILRMPKEQLSPQFTERHINGLYYSWGAAVADVNHDGIPDVIAGPYYYLGPDYTEAHEIFTPLAYNPFSDYPQGSMVTLAADFTGDGWPDVLVMSGSAGLGIGTLYVNPRGESRHWDHYEVLPHVGNETTVLADLMGDGKPVVIHAMDKKLQYSRPDPANPTGAWITTAITEVGPWGANIGHGIGVGDINGDGLPDLISPYGWWEHPKKGSQQATWTYHPQEFGRWGHTAGGAGAAELGVYDVNGDGLNDVVTALEGHGFGLAWYEQKRDSAGKISFVQHIIMDNFITKNAGDVLFTELHSTAFADIDGDGIPDIITGKRAMSHLFDYGDPDPFGPAVLYVYRTVRNPKAPGGAEFVPTLIHNFSGVGSSFAVADLNGDGMPDIVTSGIYGTFVFLNHMKK
jgi:hypothetical protein